MKLWSRSALCLALFVGFLTGHAALPQLESLRPKAGVRWARNLFLLSLLYLPLLFAALVIDRGP